MNNKEMTEERENLLNKFDKMLPSDESVNILSDSDAICLDSLSNSELAFMMQQHEENVKHLASKK